MGSVISLEKLGGGWILVLITASNVEEAKRIAEKLVEKKLAACVNIVEKIHSIYWWQGKIEESSEALLIVKTRITKLDELIDVVKSIHSYEVPEIIALPIIGGYSTYLEWLNSSIE